MAALPPRKRPGKHHHGDLRRALIDAALRTIEREGVAAVTTRALARQLGVSHAAPGHHFRDREALLIEVAAEGFRAFAEALEVATREREDPEELIVAIGRTYVRFACAHAPHLEVMFSRTVHEHARSAALEQEAQRAYRVLTGAVEALAAARPEIQAPIQEVAFSFWSLVHGMSILWSDGLPSGPDSALCALGRATGTSGVEALELAAERALRRAIAGMGRGRSGKTGTAPVAATRSRSGRVIADRPDPRPPPRPTPVRPRPSPTSRRP
jgi:AcrR family transcriptional regulator